MYRLLFLLLFVFSGTNAQINKAKRDSLAQVIEAQSRATRSYQDSFLRIQDSTLRARDAIHPKPSSGPGILRVDRRPRYWLYAILVAGALLAVVAGKKGLSRKRAKRQ